MESKFEFFPKDKDKRVIDAFFYLILLGTFGAHQFYLGNKSRGLYLLITCGISHILLVLYPYLYQNLYKAIGPTPIIIAVFSGYFLGAPVWLWDLITLKSQVRDKNGHADLL